RLVVVEIADDRHAHPRPDAELVEERRGVDPFHRRYRATRARPPPARLRTAVPRLRLRAEPSPDATAVRTGHRPAACAGGGAGPGAGTGGRRRARVVPHRPLRRGREAFLGCAADPGVLTVSFHENGRYLFPGTGFADEIGEGPAAGSVVNVPLPPDTGDDAWLAAVTSLVPELADAFGPDLVVSQHGADSHAWDPLAHLRNTTTAMGAAARLVHDVAHQHAGGRWLATGGGGYDVY